MPHSDTIPVSASIASTGTGIRYVGQHCYAYSGAVSVSDSEVDLLSFNNESGYIIAVFQPSLNFVGGTDTLFNIYLNELIVLAAHLKSTSDYTPLQEMEVIIPPNTKFRATGENVTDAGTVSVMGVLTGRVYGAE